MDETQNMEAPEPREMDAVREPDVQPQDLGGQVQSAPEPIPVEPEQGLPVPEPMPRDMPPRAVADQKPDDLHGALAAIQFRLEQIEQLLNTKLGYQ